MSTSTVGRAVIRRSSAPTFTVMVVVPVPPFVPRNVTVMREPSRNGCATGRFRPPARISRQFTRWATREELQKRRPNAKFRGWLDGKIRSQEVGLTFSQQFLRVAPWRSGHGACCFQSAAAPQESQTNAHVTVV
jgi:hypothetical protein